MLGEKACGYAVGGAREEKEATEGGFYRYGDDADGLICKRRGKSDDSQLGSRFPWPE